MNYDWSAFARQLEVHYGLFYTLFNLGRPVWTTNIPTAGVRFDTQGNQILFVINPKFWAELDDYQRCFVVGHECLHVLLEHGRRTRAVSLRLNIAMDISVNHALVESFAFSRQQLGWLEAELAWVDTIFPGQDFPTDANFEFYYNRLPAQIPMQGLSGRGSLDDHSALNEATSNLGGVIEKMQEKLDGLSQEERKAISHQLQKLADRGTIAAGSLAGQLVRRLAAPVKQSPKWETIIQHYARVVSGDREGDHWLPGNRRHTLLSPHLFLPSPVEIPRPEQVHAVFYLDTSGSCYDYAPRFVQAIRSLPDTIRAEAYGFDTRIYPIDLKARKLRLEGFGGTDYAVLETHASSFKPYPRLIVVLTDGYGTAIHPQYPQHWVWLLTEEGEPGLIPTQSRIYQLSQFA
jgi:predicted metal-dependent peptidase